MFVLVCVFLWCGDRPIRLLRGHNGSKRPAGIVGAKREAIASESSSMNEGGLKVLLHPPFTNNRANEVSETVTPQLWVKLII